MIPKVFLDTNVAFDLLSGRKPFWKSIAILSTMAEKGQLQFLISALSFSTIDYLLLKQVGKKESRTRMIGFRQICDVIDLTQEIIDKSLISDFEDFEDALQYYSALQAGCTVILSRDIKGFKLATLPVMSADEYLMKQGKKL